MCPFHKTVFFPVSASTLASPPRHQPRHHRPRATPPPLNPSSATRPAHGTQHPSPSWRDPALGRTSGQDGASEAAPSPEPWAHSWAVPHTACCLPPTPFLLLQQRQTDWNLANNSHWGTILAGPKGRYPINLTIVGFLFWFLLVNLDCCWLASCDLWTSWYKVSYHIKDWGSPSTKNKGD